MDEWQASKWQYSNFSLLTHSKLPCLRLPTLVQRMWVRKVDETPSGALPLAKSDIHLARRGFIQAREPMLKVTMHFEANVVCMARV